MRLELTRKTDLALRAIRALHEECGRLPGRSLAQKIETTTPFVAHVVTPLVNAGWLDSRPGPTGGYALTVDPHSITILDVVEAIEGPIDSGQCVMVGGPCGFDVCSMHEAWDGALKALRKSFADLPIIDA